MKKESDEGSDLYIRDALKMTMEEKAVSYLYRYFIFKKIRQISPATLKNMLNEVVEESSESSEATPSSPKYDTMTPSPSPSPLSPTEPIQFTTKKGEEEEDKKEEEQVKEPEMPKMKMKKVKGKKFRL